MKISTKGLYAVRLMLYLAEHDGGGPVSLKEVSESLGISKKYLEQIVSNVVTAKLVRSVRGAAGGYLIYDCKKDEELEFGCLDCDEDCDCDGESCDCCDEDDLDLDGELFSRDEEASEGENA